LLDRLCTMLHFLPRAAFAAALGLFITSAAFAAAGQNRLTDMRYWTSPTFTRLVFDLKAETTWETQEQKDSNRLVVELDGFDGFLPKELLEVNDGIVKKVRALQSGGKVRILIELEKPVEHKIFVLKKINEKPPRLVIDLTRSDLEQADRVHREETRKQKKKGDYIVVIDPGHGGEDPGAVSPQGAYEKDLVLAICKQLAAKLASMPGIKAYLTRKGDYFIPLSKRAEIAREYGADLFLSVHVNAGFSTKAAGSSVYCLSFKGASNNVARVAEARENASDSIGGVPLEQQKSNLNVILCDLVQTHTINSSVQLAGLLLNDVGKFNKLYLNSPQQANFAVLRAPETPSVLIETDFISSPDREKMLKSREFQTRFVDTVAATVAAYLSGRQSRESAHGTQISQSPAAQPPADQDKAAPSGDGAKRGREKQAEAGKPVPPSKRAESALPPAPAGGKYRVVKKSDTEYSLVPIDSAQAQAPAPALPVPAESPKPQPGRKPAAAAIPKSKTSPAPAAPVTVQIEHVVKKGESLTSIAQKYQMPVKELCSQNNLPLTTKVQAGVKLIIIKPKSSQP
jgi:N-acetylmuramoyl-L-alanine amidase